MSQEKDEGNSAFGQTGARRRPFNPNIPTSAELEFSVDRKSPRLIPAKTSGILASSCIPDLIPIWKNKVAGILNPACLRNGFEDDTSGAKNCNNSTTLNEPKVMNSKNSVISKVFNFEEKESYRNFLAKHDPNLYNTDKQESVSGINLDNDDHKTQRPEEPIDIINNLIQTVSAYLKPDLSKYTPPSSTKELPAVKPVNSLKDKHDLIPMLQPNWHSKFEERREKSSRMRSQKIKEQEENVRKLARETREQERFARKRLENYLIRPKMEESEEEDEKSQGKEEEFPEITEEDDKCQAIEEEFPEITEEDIKNATCASEMFLEE